MLMHGCKEGQCASCKSFILEGEDIEHDKYSTFALPDYEKEEGYTLLCRAHAYEDVTIELLNYDEDMIRSGLPIQQADRRGGVQGPGDARHAPPGAAADRAGRGQVLPRPVHGHRRARHRPGPVVLDGEHLKQGRAARVRHQGVPGRAVLPVPRPGTPGRRPPGADRPVRRLHLARVRRGAGLRGRRSGDGPDPVPAPLHGRARHPPQGHVLLRRPRAARPLLRGRAARDRGEAAELHLHPGSLARGLGRRERPHHRCRQAPDRRPSPARTPTSAGRRPWWRPRSRCSRRSASRKSGSITTSSRQPESPHELSVFALRPKARALRNIKKGEFK